MVLGGNSNIKLIPISLLLIYSEFSVKYQKVLKNKYISYN